MNQPSAKLILEDLQFSNDIGEIEPNFPFHIFGTKPMVNSYFVFGSKEWWNKKITEISIRIFWKKKGLTTNFYNYYLAYSSYLSKDDIYVIDNASFEVSFKVKKNGNWVSVTKVPLKLFEVNEKDNSVLKTTTFNLKFLKNLVFYSDGKIGELDENNLSSKEGLIKMELVAPEIGFGHDIYPAAFAEYAVKKSRWGPKRSESFADYLRKKAKWNNSSAFYKFWKTKPKRPLLEPSRPYNPMVEKIDISMKFLKT